MILLAQLMIFTMPMGSEKKNIIDWESLSKWEIGVMVIMVPIFALVAGLEHIIAKLTGATYNEVNIVIYYLLIPLSWVIMADYLTKLPFLTPMFVMAWIIFLWKDQLRFRDRCDLMFSKSVEFLLWFKRIGWNYVISSVIICVVIPILIYIELIYAIC